MKKTIVIVGHPNIERSVINRYWTESLMGKVTLHYLEEAAPLDKPLDVVSEQALLEQYERIIFQFPLYWYGAPAIFKRWLDEIMTFGWAYGAGGDKLKGKELGVAVSCGGAQTEFSLEGYQMYSLEEYMRQYEGVAAFVQMKWIGLHAFYDTFSEDVFKRLPENSRQYLAFLQK